MKSRISVVLASVAILWMTGCAHQVKFEDVHYDVNESPRDEALVALIDAAERRRVVPVRAAMTGIAHSWDAEPGTMLVQVAEIELPQMFRNFRMEERLPANSDSFVLDLRVPDYRFSEFRAYVTMHAQLTDPQGQMLLDQSYQAEGGSRGGRMFWGGAFAMKSAMRTSSLDAFKEVFASLRADLARILDELPNGGEAVVVAGAPAAD